MFVFPWLLDALLLALLVQTAILTVAELRRRLGYGVARPPFEPGPPAIATSLEEAWRNPPGWSGRLRAVNHRIIGLRMILTAFGFFLIAGTDSLVLRTQLAVPDSEIMSPYKFNQLFTMHGTAMMLLFAVPMLEGLSAYLLPLMLGARDAPFPRLNAFGYWTYLFGGLLLYSSTLPDPINIISIMVTGSSVLPDVVPDAGWYAYPPLSLRQFSPGPNLDFWLLGVTFAEISGLTFAIEAIVAVLKTRAPGMALHRMPIFVWGFLATAFAILFAFPAVIVASLLLELERKLMLPFYDPTRGGDPLLWQHLFWFFGHPEVYIQLIPATGIISMVLPVFAHRPIAGYLFIVFAVVTTAYLSFGLWVHHMFTVGLPWLALGFFGISSKMITIPSGIQVFAWIATLWHGRRLVINTAVLFAIGFIVTFVLGGITGVMVAAVPFDWQVHDTYFVVAHFHYVLVGGVVFPIFAGLYFWFPKMTGRLLDERLGTWNFWLMFTGFNVAFLPQHNAGLLGMPRRVFTYLLTPELRLFNIISTVGALLMAVGILVFIWNAYRSWRRGNTAGANPWNAGTLEWATSSPPPGYNFRTPPEVRSRDPLWDQADERLAGESAPDIEANAESDGDRRPVWRETLVTTSLEARPEAAMLMPGPTILPLLLALAFAAFFVGVLFDAYVLAGLGVAAGIVVTIIWLLPDAFERRIAESGVSVRPYVVPVQVHGSRAVGWWGLVLFIAVLAITLVNLLFSYAYLAFDAAAWPPAGIDPPDLDWPIIAIVLLLVSLIPMRSALGGVRHGSQRRLKWGLMLSFVLGVAFLLVQAFAYGQTDYAPQTHAYGAIFFTLAGYHALLVLIGLGMNAVTQTEAWLGRFNAKRFLAVENTALFWYFSVVAWIFVFATIYLVPHLV